MFPRLSALQWTLFVAFLAFYGFAVFALTRDYYLRHPLTPAASADAPHQLPAERQADAQALGERMRQALDGAPDGSEIDLGSTDSAALAAAADRLFVARRFDQAIPVYQRVLELKPDDADTRNDLGLALHYTGRSEDAIAMLRKGAQEAPEFQRIWLSLGFVALQAGEIRQARDALERAEAIAPDTEVGREAARLLGVVNEAEAPS
ncbi:MAG: tetratricopeptide repeat protein [Gammaproteobacteria bacterium]|jgi:tetratricopeptide (TPR) repeat protein|nr:tetratricopeptide repeat protein [Gammaproteobacteria bacterium]